jgi:hypothetical protein
MGSIMMELGAIDVAVVIITETPVVPVIPNKKQGVLSCCFKFAGIFAEGNSCP